MTNQRSQLEATFLSRLQPPASPDFQPAEQGELAGRRRDPSLFSLSLHRIRPDENQVRRYRKAATDPSVQELALSIRTVGVLQPIDVRYVREGDFYEIVAGERRFAAAKLAGLQDLPVKLLDATDSDVRRLQILENIQREELSPLELGTALLQLAEAGATADDLCKLLSKSQSFVTKALGVARNLSANAKRIIQDTPDHFQSMAHLYEVSLLPSELQQAVLKKIFDARLTRDELQVITSDIKQKIQPSQAARGGRPRKAPTFTKTIALQDATVTIRLQQSEATAQQLAAVLRQAIETLA